MIGTLLNVAGIVVGGVAGLVMKTSLSAACQNSFKLGLGLLTACSGLYLTWISLAGPFLRELKQLAVVVLALIAGKVAGRLLHLQKASNRLGRFARDRVAGAKPDKADRFTHGFEVCAILFCAAPLGMLGAVSDGLSGYFEPLLLKGLIDGLATMGFVSIFGRGVVLSAIPVLVFQGTLSLCFARFATPWLQAHASLGSVNATAGLLIFSVALIILDLRKVEVTDYLPSLLLAPLFAFWLH